MKKFYFTIFLSLMMSTSQIEAIVIVPKAPTIDVKSYVLLDAETGTIIASFEETAAIKPASITKLMTAYAAFQAIKEEQVRLDDSVRISQRASSIGGSTMFLNPYMDVTVNDLLQGMIIISGNDASVALAEHLAGSEETFAEYMNMYAEVLGLKSTNYTNASGLDDDDHYSSALDIAMLASQIINEFPEYFHLYSQRSYTFDQAKDPKTKEPIVQYNRNKLLRRDASIDGMKTGYTSSAGYCLVATANKNSMRLIAVVTGAKSSEDRNNSAYALLNYGFRFFEKQTLIEKNKSYGKAEIWKGTGDTVELIANEDVVKTITKGISKDIERTVDIFDPVIAPLNTTDPIGKLTITYEGKSLAESPLYAKTAVEQDNLWGRLYDSALLLFK
jgi:D-alanyl-D-alanine carboxypeptidase (penicillin-binding protein 5/6)